MADKTEIWECPQCGEALDIGALGFYARVECPGCQYVEQVHTMLANFRIEGIVGVGGMSVVLRARDLVLNRSVAIKVLNDAYRDRADRISRFENECAMMAKVRHENVVSVYSAGRARRQFYIAMELVDGCDLETLVTRDGPLPALQAVDYTIQVVQGLAAAHKSGLLHRDMKPGNVIITPEGRAKVLDFGLALGKQDEDTEEVIWATPFYVPPETLERKEEDARTDIYALGMTLRYLLTGKESFKESTNSVKELLQCKFRLPSLATILPHADESLCDLVDHMTDYYPDKRPSSYKALLAELIAVQGVLKTLAEEQRPETRRRSRKRLLLRGGVTAALAGIALAIGIGVGAPEPQRALVQPERAAYTWEEKTKLREAEAELAAGNYASAYSLFNTLAVQEGVEPTLAAWAAAHAAVLAEITERPQLAQSNLERVTALLESKAVFSPAGADLRPQLAQLKVVAEGKQPRFVVNPQLRMLCHLWYVHALLQKGNPDIAAWLNNARSAAAAAPAPYNLLEKEFNHLVAIWAPVDKPEYKLRQAQLAMKQHDIAEADRLLELVSRQKLSAALQTEAQVLSEVCQVASAALDMLQRCCGGKFEPGMSPDSVANLLKGRGKEALAAEMRCLFLLLQGKYKEAFAMKPELQKHSSAPSYFVPLLEDWERRL